MTVALQSSQQALQMLRHLGLDPQRMMKHLAGVQHHTSALNSMIDDFAGSAGMSTQNLQGMLAQGAIPANGLTAPPNAKQCGCRGQYAQPETFDFGDVPNQAPNSAISIANRQNAMKIERLVNANPAAKQALESRLGGRILPDGQNDGVMRVQRMPPGALGRGASGSAAQAAQSLGGIARGAASMGAASPFGAGAYPAMMAGALANTLGFAPNVASSSGALPQRRLFSVDPFDRGAPVPGAFGGGPAAFGAAPALGGAPAFGAAPAFGGAPALGAAPAFGGAPAFGAAPSLAAPGGIGAPAFGAAPGGSAFGADGGFGSGGIGGALNAPGMTMEDKVVMLLMQITKGFDKQIEQQANAVNQMQQQQGKGGGKGGKGGGSSKSIDVETMKLKRLIDKRGQMFDMLRQVIDKYNETAKNMIQSVAR